MKYSNLVLIFGLVFLAATQWSCETELFGGCTSGDGTIETRVVDLDEIDAFGLSMAATLTIKEGSEGQRIEIRSYPNVIDKLIEDSRVRNGKWNIGINGCVRGIGRDELEIFATVASLREVTISGSGDVFTDGVFENVEDLELKISGSGDMQLALGQNVRKITSKTSGSGDYKLSGAAEILDVTISGSGEMKAFDLEALKCDISVSGSGDCEVAVVDELDVRISGSGDVCYRGNPSVNTNINGSGNVNDCN
ncbi:MAG: head GIN domain-containing protein [Bacteroidota bacterium]